MRMQKKTGRLPEPNDSQDSPTWLGALYRQAQDKITALQQDATAPHLDPNTMLLAQGLPEEFQDPVSFPAATAFAQASHGIDHLPNMDS